MVTDLLRGQTGSERFEAMGNLMALGLLTWVVYPALDAGIQKLTGDPNAKKLRRGPASIPAAVQELYEGDRAWPQVVASVITLAPPVKLAGAAAGGGRDPFTGQSITEPEAPLGAQAAQVADWTLGQAVQPYQLLGRKPSSEGGRSIPETLRDQVLGLKDTSEAALHGKAKAKKFQKRAAQRRANKPRGPLERLYGGTSD
jgi:hypothetical protein